MSVYRFWFRWVIWLSAAQLGTVLMARAMFPALNRHPLWDLGHLPPISIMIFYMGLIAGGIVTPMIRERVVAVSIEDKQESLYKLTNALSSEGYQPVLQQDDVLVFKPTAFPHSFLFPDPISVRLEKHTITLSGPDAPVKRLQKQIAPPES